MAESERPRVAVAYSPPPPQTTDDMVPVFSVTPGKVHQVWCLSDRLWGHQCHFDGIRRRQCTAHLGQCWADHLRWRPLWQGWLHVTTAKNYTGFLLRVLPGALRLCPELAVARTDLRGARLEVRRLGDTKQDRIGITLYLAAELPARLPLSIDVPARIEKMFSAPLREVTLERLRQEGRLVEGELSSGH